MKKKKIKVHFKISNNYDNRKMTLQIVWNVITLSLLAKDLQSTPLPTIWLPDKT
jgi:hypothetical protein